VSWLVAACALQLSACHLADAVARLATTQVDLLQPPLHCQHAAAAAAARGWGGYGGYNRPYYGGGGGWGGGGSMSQAQAQAQSQSMGELLLLLHFMLCQ
jgi:hypothetical protein